MARRSRLDAELVRRGLARSREHAVALISEGRVAVSGRAANKPATGVEPGTPVVVRTDPDQPSWVSRGAHKLLGALDAFPVAVEGRRALDAGASTGGFTEVLLARGAAEVVAVDVGYGELAWSLRTDERVVVHERTNVRGLTPEAIGGAADLELRLHHRQQVGTGVGAGGQRREDQPQGDEREVGDDQLDRAADGLRRQLAHVGPLVHDDPVVGAQ